MTINILPDDVLLHIFHFDRVNDLISFLPLAMWRDPGTWHRLVHVCRRWRSVVFMSPNFLDLRLVCYPWTRLELLGIWPPLPIVIRDAIYTPSREDYDLEAAIVHRNRVCEIYLIKTTTRLQRLASAMQGQFPALTHFKLDYFSRDDTSPTPTLPDDFLVGTAPCLQFLELQSIAFPALPKFLLSVTDLVYLSLWRIPHSGYISPEAIVTGLAVLTNLEYLNIEFKSPLSRPYQESRHSPPPTRTVLPALTSFRFKGVSEYLDGLMARIDAPLLDSIRITFVHQRIFDSPQLTQFMRRTARFQTLNEAHVYFDSTSILVQSSYFVEESWLIIIYQDYSWEPSFLAHVMTSIFPSFYKVEHLYIHRPRYLLSQWLNDIENLPWPDIFHPFTTVKSLYVCKEFAQCITLALGERRMGALPTLGCLFLEEEFPPSEPVQEAIGTLVAARQLLGHPLAVSPWYRHWQ